MRACISLPNRLITSFSTTWVRAPVRKSLAFHNTSSRGARSTPYLLQGQSSWVMKSRRSFSILTALGGCLLLGGCSEQGPKTVPVYGVVTFAGRDAPKTCRLFFKPIKVEGLNRPAVAERAANGKYAAKAFSTSRGLVPGTYRIEISYYDLTPGKDPNLESSWAETNFNAGEVVVEAGSSGVEKNIEVSKKG